MMLHDLLVDAHVSIRPVTVPPNKQELKGVVGEMMREEAEGILCRTIAISIPCTQRTTMLLDATEGMSADALPVAC